VIAERTGTFYGIAMKSGGICTIAGGGTGCPATADQASPRRSHPATA
jgi:hypothetical protein